MKNIRKVKQVKRLIRQVSQLYEQNRYAEATELALQAYNLALQYVRPDHPVFEACLDNLGLLYFEMGKYSLAEPLYRQLLEIRQKRHGESHPDIATSLNILAGLYYQTGDYARAEPLYLQALAIRRAAFGDTHPDVAQSIDNLALLYSELGKYAQAEALYKEALIIWRTALGDIHPDVATNLDNLALLYYKMGQYAQAEPLYTQALLIRQTCLGETHLDVANSLNNLALLYKSMGQYARAAPLYQRALTIRRSILGETHPDVGLVMNNLGSLYHEMGEYVQAEEYYQRGLTSMRSSLGETHPLTLQCLSNLGSLYREKGEYAEAQSLYQRVYIAMQATLGDEHPDVAKSLINLGSLSYERGEYAQAEVLCRRGLASLRRSLGETHPVVATSLDSVGSLYKAMGDYFQAKALIQQSLDIQRTALGEQHPDVAQSLSHLAGVYSAQGEYTQAEPLLQQALEIRRKALGDIHPDVAESLNSLAVLYSEVGNYNKAEPLYQQALEIQRKTLGNSHPNVSTTLNNLALLSLEMGKYAQAEALYQQALVIQRTALGDTHPDLVSILSNLAVLYVLLDRRDEALALLKQALDIGEKMIGQIFSVGSERQRMMYLRTHQGTFNTFLSLVLHYLSQSPEAVQAALDLVLRRKALGSEVLAAQRDAILGGHYPDLASELRELTTLRMQIAQKTLAGPGSEDMESYQQRLRDWYAQKEWLESDLAHQIPEMNLVRQLQAANRHTVAGALPEKTVLIEFVRVNLLNFTVAPAHNEARWKPAHYIAFSLTVEEPEHGRMIDLGEADSIDEHVATYITALTAEAGPSRHLNVGWPGSAQTGYASIGRALRMVLFDPLLTAVGGCKRLLLVPDGNLVSFPFEVLPTDDGRHLIDEYQISYLSAGRDLLRFVPSSPGQTAPPLVMADPDFDLGEERVHATGSIQEPRLSGDALPFERLSGTRREGEQVAALLGVEPLLGEAALEATLKAVRSPRILHIATHGFFWPDQQHAPGQAGTDHRTTAEPPKGKLAQFLEQHAENILLRSVLVLAGVNTWNRGGSLPEEAEDGLLTAEDVSGLDLLETDLVVLSACETGLGRVWNGEGVYGLRRAFVLAGAKTLVMSLWKVPDRQTQELMEDFYQRLLSGRSRAEALREAQLAMKNRYPQPYYWGAFICQGDPGLLAQQQPPVLF